MPDSYQAGRVSTAALAMIPANSDNISNISSTRCRRRPMDL
jgi:hypothetical protein